MAEKTIYAPHMENFDVQFTHLLFKLPALFVNSVYREQFWREIVSLGGKSLLLKSACIFEMIIDMNKSQHEMDVASWWLPIDTKIQTVSEVSNVYFSCYKKEFLVCWKWQRETFLKFFKKVIIL